MIVRQALEERQLDHIIIHPTLIPRLHADAFRKGEIRVGRVREDGFQVYEKTDKANSNVDYFPTGNIFLPPETRKVLIELALAEAGLGNRVEVAFYPEAYNTRGFQGVIGEIKRRHRGVRFTPCTARISAACLSARSATSVAGSTRGASCAATRSRRQRSVSAPRA